MSAYWKKIIIMVLIGLAFFGGNLIVDKIFEKNENQKNIVENTISYNELENILDKNEEIENVDVEEESVNNSLDEEDKMYSKKLILKIGEKEYTASLYENETTKELVNKLPLKINMSELNGNEKYYNLESEITVKPEKVTNIKKGDIMLYDNNCLVLFYDSFFSEYSYTKIGFIEETECLEDAVGNKNIEINWSIEEALEN